MHAVHTNVNIWCCNMCAQFSHAHTHIHTHVWIFRGVCFFVCMLFVKITIIFVLCALMFMNTNYSLFCTRRSLSPPHPVYHVALSLAMRKAKKTSGLEWSFHFFSHFWFHIFDCFYRIFYCPSKFRNSLCISHMCTSSISFFQSSHSFDRISFFYYRHLIVNIYFHPFLSLATTTRRALSRASSNQSWRTICRSVWSSSIRWHRRCGRTEYAPGMLRRKACCVCCCVCMFASKRTAAACDRAVSYDIANVAGMLR